MSKRSDARINVAFVDEDERVFRPRHRLLPGLYLQLFRTLCPNCFFSRQPGPDGLFLHERVYVRSVCDGILNLTLDRV